jgi:ketosteroid isomerase-like protein
MSIENSSIDLPGVAREYFAAANALDIDRTAALFAEEAFVTDEGKRIDGREAIHEWVARTMREFEVTAIPEHVDVHDGVVAVTALVTGGFPGSPVTLTFRFTVAGDRIAGLEIQ